MKWENCRGPSELVIISSWFSTSNLWCILKTCYSLNLSLRFWRKCTESQPGIIHVTCLLGTGWWWGSQEWLAGSGCLCVFWIVNWIWGVSCFRGERMTWPEAGQRLFIVFILLSLQPITISSLTSLWFLWIFEVFSFYSVSTVLSTLELGTSLRFPSITSPFPINSVFWSLSDWAQQCHLLRSSWPCSSVRLEESLSVLPALCSPCAFSPPLDGDEESVLFLSAAGTWYFQSTVPSTGWFGKVYFEYLVSDHSPNSIFRSAQVYCLFPFLE